MIASKLKKLGVVAVYLFGSQAKGCAGPLSDYDIGILLNESIELSAYLDIKLQLMPLFAEYFNHPKIEVAIINAAPPLLAMNIISEGKLLFDFSPFQRASFETHITMAYLDRLPYEERHLETLTK